MMLETVCAHIHNYFCDEDAIVSGTWTVEDGAINLDGVVLEGQYFRVVGSALNDGVYQYPATDMAAETFTGQIWPMKPPRLFLQTVTDIEAWQAKYGEAMASPYQSESVIGVYSRTKQGGNTTQGAAADADGWKSAFRSRLNPWRKLR